MPKFQHRLWSELHKIDFRRITIALTTAIFIPVLCCSLLAYLGEFDRLLELMTHFRLQYLLGGIVATIVYALSKQKIGLLLALFCVGLNAIEIVPWYLPTAQSSDRDLRVMISNVMTSNRRYGDVIDYVRAESPDVLVVMEMDLTWQQHLAPLKSLLPYSIEEPRADNFGLAIFSKIPLANPQVREWGKGAIVVPSLTANITVRDRVVSVIATHPVPPSNEDYFMSRNSQINELGDYVRQLGNEAIVMGDLNMSMWSPYYRKFIDRANLRNTRQGFGIQPSWPTNLRLLQIPIDHCSITSKITVLNNRLGKDIGSDHYPLVVDLAVVKPTFRSLENDQNNGSPANTVISFAYLNKQANNFSFIMSKFLNP
jgi:endonuclease/exonuclease/phosphatase (EEP) superfamily protein YafD